MAGERKLAKLLRTYKNKAHHNRNDLEQKKLVKSFLDRDNNMLVEKERLARSRSRQTCIDVIINQSDEGTELYVPVKTNQTGPLTSLLADYCRQVMQEASPTTTQEGSYKKYIVLRLPGRPFCKGLAEKLVADQPTRFAKYKVDLLPSYNNRFESDAVYDGDLLAQPHAQKPGPATPPHQAVAKPKKPKGRVRKKTYQTTATPKADITAIKGHMNNGLNAEEIAAQMPSYQPKQVSALMRHITSGTYDKPKKDIDDDLQNKIFTDFGNGLTPSDVASKYDLNRFQAVAQKAQYTRRKNKGEI